ncbi:periplasmic binding protein-like II [Neocallimastix californiae]|uniref:Periplasmic binding protein-like II n=1 Tax=Neocallimastix californiae TaxID=1754190 RepID=A0A1Y1YER6_9FUNG|nr:periplasmic binding protein-like II [Neocallimastix californiae]|eukprot:ORX96084.1 periplasmic binding protein-like II [Neocallimastix californiae]
MYTSQNAPYLLKLDQYLPKEHIDMYNKHILSQIGYHEGHLVALPATIDYSALFSNKALLKKYNKPIPKTWNELIETGKYILEKERAEENTDIIGYNGLFDEYDGPYSFIEFIYSCRESVDSPFPDLNNKIFESDSLYNIFDNKTLFMKYYYIPGLIYENFPYDVTIMPGIKEGISGTVLVGYNIGIVNNISEKKKKSAIEAVKYFTSREMQKKLVSMEYIISGISDLYDDELCSQIRFCDVYKNSQAIQARQNKLKNNDYFEKITKYFYEFLFGDETAGDILVKIEDLSKIYTLSISTKDSYKKIRNNYTSFLPRSDWFMIIIGIVMILCGGLTEFGNIRLLIIYIPILQKLIITFPNDKNKYSLWFKNNKYLFYSFIIIFDILLNALTLIKPYEVIIINEGKRYQICYKVILALVILLLIFIEWNLLYFILYNSRSINSLLAFTNFIILYFVRILLNKFNKKDEMDILFERFRASKSSMSKTYVSNQNSTYTNKSTSTSVLSKILTYHKQEFTINDSDICSKMENNN